MALTFRVVMDSGEVVGTFATLQEAKDRAYARRRETGEGFSIPDVDPEADARWALSDGIRSIYGLRERSEDPRKRDKDAAVEAVGDAMFDAIARGGDIYAAFREALRARGNDEAALSRAAARNRSMSVVAVIGGVIVADGYGDCLERRDRGGLFAL